MLLPSKAHAEWHALATAQLREQNAPQTKVEKFDLTVQFYAPDLRKTDVSNKLESVNDLLVDFGVIEDDSWFNIQDLHLPPVTLDRENPRAEITIIPLVP